MSLPLIPEPRLLILASLFFSIMACKDPAPQPVFPSSFEHSLGGNRDDWAFRVIEDDEQHLLAVGRTASHSVSTLDLMLVKLNANGHLIWEKTYHRANWHNAFNLIQSRDGGYLILAQAGFNNGQSHIWLIKLDRSGEIEWEKTYDWQEQEEGHALVQVSNGDYVVAFYGRAIGSADVCNVIRVGQSGSFRWRKEFKLSHHDGEVQLMARENGGFVLVSSGLEDSTQQYGIWQGYLAEDGSLLSEQWYHQHPSAILQGALLDTDQRLTLLANVGQEARLFQLDQQGTLLWEQKLQGLVRDLTATRKGGFALTGFHSPNGGPNTDAFITAVDAKGELIWNQSFGGNDTDLSESILQAEDGGFVIVGAKRSQSIGLRDFWILKVNENGLN